MTVAYYSTERAKCLIWQGYPAKRVTRHPDNESLSYVFGSPRAGGDYAITNEAVRRLNGNDSRVSDSVRARLTTILIESRDSWG